MRTTLKWLALACLLLSGCETAVQQSGGDGAADQQSDVAGATSTGDGRAKVKVQINSWTETAELVASHRGKIVILDAWAMW